MLFAVTSISAFAPPALDADVRVGAFAPPALDADVPVGVTSGSVPLTLLPQTEGDLSPACLDGSPYGFFYVPGAADSKSWTIDIQGGGWCYDEAGCYSRSLTRLGSSKYFPTTGSCGSMNVNAAGIDHTSHCIYMQYCDGASFSGYRADPWPVPTNGLGVPAGGGTRTVDEMLRGSDQLTPSSSLWLTNTSRLFRASTRCTRPVLRSCTGHASPHVTPPTLSSVAFDSSSDGTGMAWVASHDAPPSKLRRRGNLIEPPSPHCVARASMKASSVPLAVRNSDGIL